MLKYWRCRLPFSELIENSKAPRLECLVFVNSGILPVKVFIASPRGGLQCVRGG